MTLSIIVPVLNEAPALPGLLERLVPLQRRGCNILIVDGGSEDGSPVVAELAGFTVLRTPRGRAQQMNAGAGRASGQILLFLHADTQLPHNASALVHAALAGPDHCWGRFDVRIDGRHLMLRVVERMMNLRSRWTGIATGDQAMFVTRTAFDSIGGFANLPLMEDIELSRRLRRLSRPACIKHCVTTSGRRWERGGVWHTIVLMWRLRWAYWRGMPPEQLAKDYQ